MRDEERDKLSELLAAWEDVTGPLIIGGYDGEEAFHYWRQTVREAANGKLEPAPLKELLAFIRRVGADAYDEAESDLDRLLIVETERRIAAVCGRGN